MRVWGLGAGAAAGRGLLLLLLLWGWRWWWWPLRVSSTGLGFVRWGGRFVPPSAEQVLESGPDAARGAWSGDLLVLVPQLHEAHVSLPRQACSRSSTGGGRKEG